MFNPRYYHENIYNVDSLKPHFYIVKLGFTGCTVFRLFLLKNIDCGYSLEPPRRGGSNEYPQYVFNRNMKILEFLSEIFPFFVLKFSVNLNRLVFVMVVETSLYSMVKLLYVHCSIYYMM